MQKVDAPTLRILKSFDVEKRGYTLVVPRNRATNFTDPNLGVEPLFSLYGIDPLFISAENATQVRARRSHRPAPAHPRRPAPTRASAPETLA